MLLPAHRVLTLTLAVAFALLVPASVGFAAPSAGEVAAAEALVERRAGEYETAASRLRRVEVDASEMAAELDELVADQERLQRRLNRRASGMYREGEVGFVEVLTSSATFAEFASRLDLLTRVNLRDARDLAALRRSKQRVARKGAGLLARQQELAAQLRRLEESHDAAVRELSSRKAARRAYLARVAAVRAESALPVEATMLKADPVPAPAPAAKGGAWKSAVASHYGRGSHGRLTADGTRIGPDSMIVAHKTLPFGTLVEFSYRGRSAVGRVADRGPYTAGRTWDLGPGVIRVLGFNGIDTVRYRVLSR